MDYEKEYKEAIERAKHTLFGSTETSLSSTKETIEYIFPELKESEDERTRKAISQCVEDMRGQFEKLYSVHHKDAIAWLEKQGENKDLPNVIDRETLDEYAYQVAYDLSNDWMKETPTWDDVETATKLGANWREKQSTLQVRTGIEWVNTIDDACDNRYSEEYAHGEYCHEQSFKWGFQEGVNWLKNKEYWRGYREGKQEVLDKYAELKKQKDLKGE